MARFLRSFCHTAAACGWLRCYCLRADDRIEGVLIAFHWRDTASFYQIGWDPEQSNTSPGVLLLAASIEQAIEERLHVYDFLQGDEDYKKRWTDQATEQITVLIGCRGRARIAVAAERMKQAVKVSAARLIRTAKQGRARREAVQVQTAPASP
jgi:CelD/BcsL family acetyltransferase involved in cellulose biosynthesis